MDRIGGIYYTTVILPSGFSLSVALSETRFRLRHMPESFPSPVFSQRQAPQENPLPGKNFPLPGIKLLRIFWIESVVYIYIKVQNKRSHMGV